MHLVEGAEVAGGGAERHVDVEPEGLDILSFGLLLWENTINMISDNEKMMAKVSMPQKNNWRETHLQQLGNDFDGGHLMRSISAWAAVSSRSSWSRWRI